MPLPMVAPVAMQMGTYLSKYLTKGVKDQYPDFIYQDKGSMATIGKHKAVVDLNYWKTQGAIAWFIWMFVHLMSLVGFGSKSSSFSDGLRPIWVLIKNIVSSSGLTESQRLNKNQGR